MSLRDNIVKVAIVILLMSAGCSDNATEPVSEKQASAIHGIVRSIDSLQNPIDFAVIEDQSGTTFNGAVLRDTADINGTYSITVSIAENYGTVLNITRRGYFDTTANVTFEVGKDKLQNLWLRRNYQTSTDLSGLPARIRLSAITDEIISAQGLGGKSSTTFTFQVLDVYSRPINASQRDTVMFILSDTSGGTYIIPEWAMTDDNGNVSGTIYSGTIYGSPTITATMNTGASIISSTPVSVRISGPYLPNFGITLSRKNLPGLSQMGTSVGSLKMQIGDKDGNPVLPGTIVTFSTTGGMVDSRAATASDGSASAKIYGGALPIDPVRGVGFGYVTARVKGDSGSTLVRQLPFLFSGEPVISVPAYPTGVIPTLNDGVGQPNPMYITFTVADSNGNPISGGNFISVACEGDAAGEIELSGSSYSTIDTWDPAQTSFTFGLEDRNPQGGGGGRVQVKITVTGDAVPQGGSVVKVLETYLLPPGVVGGEGSGYARIIYLSDAESQRSIYVRGTDGTGGGRNETATLVFMVRDSLGRAVDANHSAPMNFEFVGDSLGAEILIRSNYTDPSGRVTTLVRAGSTPGVPVVRAYTVTFGDTVRSDLVSIMISTCFPDQQHFSISTQMLNFPGLEILHLENFISVRVGDKYGNPVPAGIPVYFTCSHGIIETREAYTDNVGFIKQRLFSANPIPDIDFPPQGYEIPPRAGSMYVKAWTRGEFGAIVHDSVWVLWTGAPKISNIQFNGAGWSPTSDTFSVPHLGAVGNWTFDIMDQNDNPLSAGTTISASAGGAGRISGNADVKLPDTQTGGQGITHFEIAVEDSHGPLDPAEARKAIIVVTVLHPQPQYGEVKFIIAKGTIY